MFVPLTLGATVPDVLSSEAAWWRFARLRDRIEHDPEALGPIRAALAPVEAALAEGADPELVDDALSSLGA